ncbi:hypothetical protein KGO95_02655 [Patescibacteria group bacterium]|nr:hypothetical protein [Patescibacteria group bacterium]
MDTALNIKEKVLARGVFDHAEYQKHSRRSRSGAMVHATHTGVERQTIVHLKDGRCFVLGGHQDVLFCQGTPIKIMENGHGQRSIVQLRPRKSKSRA